MRPGGEHPRRRRAPQDAVCSALALAALAAGAASPLTAAQDAAAQDASWDAVWDSPGRITGEGSYR